MITLVLRRFSRPSRVVTAAVALSCALAVVALVAAAPRASMTPSAPRGVTAIALDGHNQVAWEGVSSATSYRVLRGSAPDAITTQVTPDGYTATTVDDATAANGTTYYYVVLAVGADATSAPSQVTQATPQARSCGTGNIITLENCFPGSTGWKTPDGTRAYESSIEGFASATSINAGESVDLYSFVMAYDVPYHIDVYRTGWYRGTQGRLVTSIRGLTAQYSPDCFSQPTTTGVFDCGSYMPAAMLTTTPAWTSGVYVLKFVRDDNGKSSTSVLVVRNDRNHADVLFGVSTATYAAYNRFGGKSVYDGLSSPPLTVSNGSRAVNVSFDRPFAQPTQTSDAHDWYPRADVATVGWLEQQGYDTAYIASEDLHSAGAQLKDHKVFISGAHDEYWSKQMFDAATAARDAGTSLMFLGANSVYWKTRYESSAVSGRANRVVITYKTVQGGPVDPSGIPTTTWRDPLGPNRPENELIGQMYVGENLTKDFPLVVSAAEGRHRVWRYTSVADQEAGSSTSVGTALVGWEWDARVSNGREPAGVVTLASSAVTGQLIQGNGASQSPGSAVQNTTIYRAPSGAVVFASGTNNWWRGLGRNEYDAGEPDGRIKQVMANLLADMGAAPSTPAAGLTVDAPGAPSVASTVPAAGASGVTLTSALKVTFDRQLDPTSVANGDFDLKASDGTVVPVTSSMDNPTETVTLQPIQALDPTTGYTLTIGPGLAGFNGVSMSASQSVNFSTGTGTPPVIVARAPSTNATGAPTDVAVKATFDRRLNPATVTSSSFLVRPTAGGAAVPATVTYDDSTRTIRLVPDNRLAESTSYTLESGAGIEAFDGVAVAGGANSSFTTGTNLQVTGRNPGVMAFGTSPATDVRVVFSRAADPATITTSTFELTDPGGQVIAAQVAYDGATRTATLTPSAALTLGETYTVTASGAIHAADGAPLAGVTSTFTVASTPPPAPAVITQTPAGGATRVSNGTTVRATFNVALDPVTVTAQSFKLASIGGSQLAATVAYDAATSTATLTPSAPLGTAATYAVTLTTAIRSTTGAALGVAQTWTFVTAGCPCQLMTSKTPTLQGLTVQDYRPGPGPFSYELGTKIAVDQTSALIALRFWKDPRESGTHVGRVWTSSGTLLASATFQDETASGWQRQVLATPVTLQPGQVYVVSTGFNAYYAKTENALGTAILSGPLRTVGDGKNGVYNGTAGQFPTGSWLASNYFVDAVVKLPSSATHVPGLVSTTPANGTTGVATNVTLRAVFDTALDPATLDGSTFKLRDAGGSAIPATVSYDEASGDAVLRPLSALDTGTTYTATVGTGLKADDETPLPAALSWTFSTVSPTPPTVVTTSPSAGTSDVSGLGVVTATFDQAMQSVTVASALKLTGPTGSVPATVAYDATARTATLAPLGPLNPSTTYTAAVDGGATSSRGIAMATPASWTFTTSPCPCSLFADDGNRPADRGLSTQNWRSGTGPWSLELGVKLKVTSPATLTAVRFYKDAEETGSHTGRVWTDTGTLLASATFTGESASGWQEQALTTPLTLTPGATYVVSIGVNASFGMTAGGLGSQIDRGPLHSVADGRNGVYGNAAGDFPTQYWGSSNYWLDAVMR